MFFPVSMTFSICMQEVQQGPVYLLHQTIPHGVIRVVCDLVILQSSERMWDSKFWPLCKCKMGNFKTSTATSSQGWEAITGCRGLAHGDELWSFDTSVDTTVTMLAHILGHAHPIGILHKSIKGLSAPWCPACSWASARKHFVVILGQQATIFSQSW